MACGYYEQFCAGLLSLVSFFEQACFSQHTESGRRNQFMLV
jgi:hypothetical protein